MRGWIRTVLLALGLFAGLPAAALADQISDTLRDAARVYLQGDFATALSLWRPLADQGNAMAMTNLGILYAKGEGVKQDYVRAHMWLSLAASFGSAEAGKYRDVVASHMFPDQIAAAQKLEQAWTRK